MTISLEVPSKLKALADQAHRVAAGMFRPISRKYDRREHEFPEELKMLGAVLRGISESTGVGAGGLSEKPKGDSNGKSRAGVNMSSLLGMVELCWGDIGLALSIP